MSRRPWFPVALNGTAAEQGSRRYQGSEHVKVHTTHRLHAITAGSRLGKLWVAPDAS